MSAVGRLIMRSARMAMMGSRCLLATFVHRKHRTTMSGSGNLGRLDIDLYFLTGSLILIIVDGITDVCGKFALGIFSGLCPWPTEGPSVPESCACIPRSGTHIREGSDRWVSLAGRGTRALFRVCQCIFRASPFHYNKLIRGKYFERLQVNVPVTLQYLGLADKIQVSYLCQARRCRRGRFHAGIHEARLNPERGCKVVNLAVLFRYSHKSVNVHPRLMPIIYRDMRALSVGPSCGAVRGERAVRTQYIEGRRRFSKVRRFPPFRRSAFVSAAAPLYANRKKHAARLFYVLETISDFLVSVFRARGVHGSSKTTSTFLPRRSHTLTRAPRTFSLFRAHAATF